MKVKFDGSEFKSIKLISEKLDVPSEVVVRALVSTCLDVFANHPREMSYIIVRYHVQLLKNKAQELSDKGTRDPKKQKIPATKPKKGPIPKKGLSSSLGEKLGPHLQKMKKEIGENDIGHGSSGKKSHR